MTEVSENQSAILKAGLYFDRLCHWIDIAVRAIISGFAASILILLMLQVIMRYFIKTPLIWVEELSSYALAFLVLWGTSCLVRSWGNIRVDTFYNAMPRMPRYVIAILLNVLIIYLGYLLFNSGHRLAQLGANDLSPSGTFGMFWPRQAMTTGAVLIMLQALNNVVSLVTGRGQHMVESQ